MSTNGFCRLSVDSDFRVEVFTSRCRLLRVDRSGVHRAMAG